DKSNLVLGTMLFESGNFELARQSLDRVRLEGPFSNQALLRAGWAEATAKHYDRALVPWNILASREPTDAAVQESTLGVANAYASLNLHGRAALKFGGALELFTNQIQRVDASINSIREGRFLKALMREETREDEDWVITLRTLPDAPETYYLMELMASHDFQTALHNYLDLEDLQSRLIAWRTSLDAFTDIIRLRVTRLRGTLTWLLETEYNDRLTAATVHLKELNTQVDALTRQYESFVRTRQAATQSYVGYDKQISQLCQRVDDAQQRVDRLMAQQGHMIEVVAINQLEARRDRLVAQQLEARYGVAASYDRAARAQAGAGEK